MDQIRETNQKFKQTNRAARFEPRVYQRGRFWHLDYYSDGKRIRESSGKTNKVAAVQELADRLNKVKEGTLRRDGARVRFFDYIGRYLDTSSNLRPSWRKNKEYHFKPLKAFFGNILLKDITPDRVADYKATRIKEQVKSSRKIGKENAPQRFVKPSTVNREFGTLSALLNKAVIENLLPYNPCQRVGKYKDADHERQRFLTKEEIQALLKECSSPLHEIVTIALNTGMRKGEIQNLKWRDITLSDEFCLINLRITKNGKPREIEMNAGVKQVFYALKRKQKPGAVDNEYIFPSDEDKKKSYQFRKAFETAAKRAGLNQPGKERVVFHSLRHTYCSQLAGLGYGEKLIMELSGHRDHRMVLQYIKHTREHRVRALERLGEEIISVTNLSQNANLSDNPASFVRTEKQELIEIK